MIKAIETRYKGYRFRSRLEARWAVFFDAMGVKWEYEKEGYDLGEAGWYLPDFQITRMSNGMPADMYVEVKGKESDVQEKEKAWALCFYGKQFVFLAEGVPGDEVVYIFDPDMGMTPSFNDREVVENVWAMVLGDQQYPDNSCTDGVRTVCNKARAARFEHGEQPVA